MRYQDEQMLFSFPPRETVKEKEARYRARAALRTHRDYHWLPFGSYKARMGPRAIIRHDNHLGMREFYFWEIPRLQYQNPNVQFVRFLEMSPLPFLRVWINENGMKKHEQPTTENNFTSSTPIMRDVLFDCDNKDRLAILNQLMKTLGVPRETQEINRRKQNQENKATFGLNRRYSCVCQVPDQVPCPGVVPLPMRMRGKFVKYKTEDLEAWETDLDRQYPTTAEIEKVHVAFPEKHPPPIQEFPGLETLYMRKPKTKAGYKNPDIHISEHQSDRLDKESDLKLFKDHKR